MKSFFIILLLVVIPFSSAFSSGDFFDNGKDFFEDYFSLTGAVILELTGKITNLGGENFDGIHPSREYISTNCLDNDAINHKFRGTCKFNNIEKIDYCNEDKTMVYEYFCNDGCSGSWRLCETYCKNGACI